MSHAALSYNEISTIAKKYSSVVVKESATGRVLFTEYGGRLLGMWPRGDGHNPLWVNPDLQRCMSGGQWMTGGERLWIAPERNFFYENPRDFEGFHVPAEIDPGEYKTTGELRFESVFSLLDYHTNEAIDGSVMRRAFSVIDDPYATSLAYVGVRIDDSITVPGDSAQFCGWSLAQIYTCGPEAPGTAFFPARTASRLVSYFNSIPPDRAEVVENHARFKIDSNDIYKLAIRPEDMLFDNSCKAVYVTAAPDGASWMCLIKRTNDMPRSQSECVDVARDNPDGPRGAIQAYNNGPGFSLSEQGIPAFGEIELQLSKAVAKDQEMVSAAAHELLAYEGSKGAILELAQKALNLGALPKLY